jgi:spore coat protein U-like protein
MMTGPKSATLSYELYRDNARTLNWGQTAGVDTYKATGSGNAQPFSIYPEMPAGQFVAPGTYTDTVTISAVGLAGITATFTVTATVGSECTISESALNFGTYSGSLITTNSTLTVTCTNTMVFNIGLNAGNSTGATVTTRKMTGPASATLNYAMFRDSSHTENWGNTVGTDTLSSTGTGSPVAFPVYGQMAAGQIGNPAVYSDTIIATITY